MTENPKPLIVLVREHCSIPGETSALFAVEWKKLDDTDKAWFRAEFTKRGIPVQ